MNGKIKHYPHCSDCGYPLLPKPTEYRDGCFVRPLFCAYCNCEKDVMDVQIIERRPEDRFTPEVHPAQVMAVRR